MTRLRIFLTFAIKINKMVYFGAFSLKGSTCDTTTNTARVASLGARRQHAIPSGPVRTGNPSVLLVSSVRGSLHRRRPCRRHNNEDPLHQASTPSKRASHHCGRSLPRQ